MTQITFDQLRDRTTPEIIKKMCELAEGFEWISSSMLKDFALKFNNINYYAEEYDFEYEIFPLLLHRCVEGWNKSKHTVDRTTEQVIVIQHGYLFRFLSEHGKPYDFDNYLPCHLTACEMAIWDCLIDVLSKVDN